VQLNEQCISRVALHHLCRTLSTSGGGGEQDVYFCDVYFLRTGPQKKKGGVARGSWCRISQPENVTAMVAFAKAVPNLSGLPQKNLPHGFGRLVGGLMPLGIRRERERERDTRLQIWESAEKKTLHTPPRRNTAARAELPASCPRGPGGGVNRSQVLPSSRRWQLVNIWQRASPGVSEEAPEVGRTVFNR